MIITFKSYSANNKIPKKINCKIFLLEDYFIVLRERVRDWIESREREKGKR